MLLSAVAVVVAAVMFPSSLAHDGYGPDLTQIKEDLATLNEAKVQLFTNLGRLRTNLGVAKEVLGCLNRRINEQDARTKRDQVLRMRTMQEQANALLHEAMNANEQVKEATELESATSDQISSLTTLVSGITSDQGSLNSDLGTLNTNMSTLVNASETSLNTLNSTTSSDLYVLDDRVDDVQFSQDETSCEVGIAVTGENLTDPLTITYDSQFARSPDVSLSIVGFRSHLDVHPDSDYDVSYTDLMSIAVEASSSSATNFTLTVSDNSDTKVVAKSVYVRWCSCIHPVLSA